MDAMMTLPRFASTGLLPILLITLLLAGCATPPSAPPDPLIGQIVEGRSATQLDRETLFARMLDADVVYLGEIHDNPHHQARQRDAVEALLAAGKAPTLAIEFFGSEQTGWLMDYAQPKAQGKMARSGPVSERILRRRVGWDGEGDDRWERYGPLLEIARDNRLPMLGIDLPPALRLRLQRVGRDGLSPVELAQLPPGSPDPEAYALVMNARLGQAHCGYGTPESVARLYDTWLARNDAMAAGIVAALEDSDHHPVVVIVGAGHVEHGQSVVRRVAELRPDTRQLVIGLRPVTLPPRPLSDHLAPTVSDGVDFGPDYQVFWFTPLQEREDPCEKYREILRKRHGAKQEKGAA
jgi:uncharacterized iron-regulated protein